MVAVQRLSFEQAEPFLSPTISHLHHGGKCPHWLMVAGAALVTLGFIGFAFHRNRNAKPDQKPPQMKAKVK
jgi:hypothetical protein